MELGKSDSKIDNGSRRETRKRMKGRMERRKSARKKEESSGKKGKGPWN